MRRLGAVFMLACGFSGLCRAARCTTVLDQQAFREYERYVAAAQTAMAAGFETGELAWVPDSDRRPPAAELDSGRLVRRNLSDPGLNRRMAGRNGAVIHWAGAILIRNTNLAELRAVLEDYDRYTSIYRPMIFECRATRTAPGAYDAILGLYSKVRFASIFPQHYSFRVKTRIDYSEAAGSAPALSVHLRSDEIRESDSGVPGRADFLEPYRDHGIMWALNAWWRARQRGPDLYLAFETVTLARSVQEFSCRLGLVPVPRSIIARVMDALPAESLELILSATKAECERRASQRAAGVSSQ